jgi:hypothetical protein
VQLGTATTLARLLHKAQLQLAKQNWRGSPI